MSIKLSTNDNIKAYLDFKKLSRMSKPVIYSLHVNLKADLLYQEQITDMTDYLCKIIAPKNNSYQIDYWNNMFIINILAHSSFSNESILGILLKFMENIPNTNWKYNIQECDTEML